MNVDSGFHVAIGCITEQVSVDQSNIGREWISTALDVR